MAGTVTRDERACVCRMCMWQCFRQCFCGAQAVHRVARAWLASLVRGAPVRALALAEPVWCSFKPLRHMRRCMTGTSNAVKGHMLALHIEGCSWGRKVDSSLPHARCALPAWPFADLRLPCPKAVPHTACMQFSRCMGLRLARRSHAAQLWRRRSACCSSRPAPAPASFCRLLRRGCRPMRCASKP